jgi:Tfp pilus assembly protein PilN
MLLTKLLFPSKCQQLRERNDFLTREIKKFKLRDSCLSPHRDTASELDQLEKKKREIKFNNKLLSTLIACYLLSLIGVYPTI